MSRVKGELTTEKLLGNRIHRARIFKTLWFLKDPVGFMEQMSKELAALERRTKKSKKSLAVARLNGTSDIPWENYETLYPGRETCIFSEFPNVQFYDYTKSYQRMMKMFQSRLPRNYYLTYSRSEDTTPKQIRKVVNTGGTVAVVFKDEVPDTYLGIPVISGDEHDFRFLDQEGTIVGLKAKGRARHDTTGFVI